MHYISLCGVHICHGVAVGGMLLGKGVLLRHTIYTFYANTAHLDCHGITDSFPAPEVN